MEENKYIGCNVDSKDRMYIEDNKDRTEKIYLYNIEKNGISRHPKKIIDIKNIDNIDKTKT